MHPYWLLAPVGIMCCVGAWATYTPWAKNANWYTPTMAGLAALCGLCFALAAKRCGADTGKVYVFSLTYDALMMVCYYLLPLVAFGTRVNAGVLAGAALVAIGLFVVHTAAG